MFLGLGLLVVFVSCAGCYGTVRAGLPGLALQEEAKVPASPPAVPPPSPQSPSFDPAFLLPDAPAPEKELVEVKGTKSKGKDLYVWIRFHGEIGPASEGQLARFVKTLEVTKPKAVMMEIDSPGGLLGSGKAMTKAIMESKVRFVCVVDGAAQSDAFFLLQSCDKRLMTEDSFLMAHEPYFTVMALSLRVDRDFLKECRKELDLDILTWSEFAAAKMKISVKAFMKRIKKGDWVMHPKEAKKVGAVDAVVPTSASAWESL